MLQTLNKRRLGLAVLFYCAALIAFWAIARSFHLAALRDFPVSTTLSFAALFAPYWFFGFGAAEAIQKLFPGTAAKVLLSGLVAMPYPMLSLARHNFHWQMLAMLLLICLGVSALLACFQQPGTWADFVALAIVGLLIDLGLLSTSWPFGPPGAVMWPAGLGGFPKMMMANLALYGYLVIKPLDGVGYDLIPKWADFRNGLREFLYYAPIVLVLGFALHFITWHGSQAHVEQFPAAWIFTFFFVALPEELYFRGLIQNLLERRIGQTGALLLASVLFGLSHFNKRAVFNWRYVILATIAGAFYGRAWRKQRRLFASSVTHSTVDAVWSIWFRM
ncbi:MAG TPA: CPBP family intramembrane glutamic endopeptidase [Candidatus Limnocylindrales bacterium]|nr:CPBP family intramembrane glutamic endopeptidase [Candidatus Limnocylindrales bacterium]